MDVKCTLKEDTSKKSGQKYLYLSIMLTPTCEKKVFLENAEVELLKMYLTSKGE